MIWTSTLLPISLKINKEHIRLWISVLSYHISDSWNKFKSLMILQYIITFWTFIFGKKDKLYGTFFVIMCHEQNYFWPKLFHSLALILLHFIYLQFDISFSTYATFLFILSRRLTKALPFSSYTPLLTFINLLLSRFSIFFFYFSLYWLTTYIIIELLWFTCWCFEFHKIRVRIILLASPSVPFTRTGNRLSTFIADIKTTWQDSNN